MPRLRALANVNVGLTANDGTGDLIRDSFIKINNNFNGMYSNGQFLAFNPDARLTPGYSWIGDRDTGMYRPGSGRIAFSLNGNESLVLNEDTTIRWFGSELATKDFLLQELSTIFGSGDIGSPGGGVPITIVDSSGELLGNTTASINGIPVVNSLPLVGNYEGRFAFYNGDVWIFSCYPVGNGAGLSADTSIGRAAGSDCRWTRFRGEGSVTTGTTLPESGFEGQAFYNATTNTLYYYVEGSWKTAASIIVPDTPSRLTILTALPATSSPDNFEGRTVLVGSTVYVFRSGAWVNFSTYVSGGTSGGISSGAALPSASGAAIGQLFRKTGTNAGLYAFDGSAWVLISTYVRQTALTTGIRAYASLPTDLTNFVAGDLVLVNNEVYILNSTKTSWSLFKPGAGANSVVSIALSGDSVGSSQLQANSVTSAKISAGAVTGNKIAANTITNVNIATGSINGTKLQANTIGADQINASSVATAILSTGILASGTITDSSISASKLNITTLSSISNNMGTITSGVMKSADNKMVIDLNNKFIRIEL